MLQTQHNLYVKNKAILILYKSNFTIGDISSLLQLSHTQIRRVLISNNIKIKNRNHTNYSKEIISLNRKIFILKSKLKY